MSSNLRNQAPPFTGYLPMPKVVIYPFVIQQVAMGQDGYTFLLLHDSYQRPNSINPFVTCQESRARLGIYPRNLKNKMLMQISTWLLNREHKITATERISYKHLIQINDKIKLKTDYGQLSHMFLSRILTGFIKGVHSFQPNCQKGPRH